MDLKNLECTSTYAIEAVYREYWHLIPEKYRILEKAERNDHGTYEKDEYDDKINKKTKSKPLSYKDVEKKEDVETDYDVYCRMLNNDQYFDLQPFFDPTGDFDNRLHYKITGADYPLRNKIWFVITYNFGNGLLNSSLTRRRFQSALDTTPGGEKVAFDFINVDMDLTLTIYSNSLQALFELQENIMVRQREKHCVNTVRNHSVLGKFPVSLDIISSSINKLPRDKGTICALTLNVKVDYPVIGNIRGDGGIIKEFHMEIDSVIYNDNDKTMSLKDKKGPDQHAVLSRDIITEDTPEYPYGQGQDS